MKLYNKTKLNYKCLYLFIVILYSFYYLILQHTDKAEALFSH